VLKTYVCLETDGIVGFFSVVLYAMKIMFYIRCYLTETTIVMNCDTDAMNEFSHQMMINVTLFTESCINTAINCFPPYLFYLYYSTAF